MLHRGIGEPAVMIEQFERLLRLTEHPHISVHVVAADAGMHAGLPGQFILVRLPDGGEVVHLDSALRTHITDRPDDVDSFRATGEPAR
ncbi:Scr1 family TA system antitoxin-like transcriptional regulator [Micromonospora sp. WMMD987]|uniref:Scr1 family TA system antitoxin-like transcriptional regulator n=1 Tax=Micromonospora sp. WMMD987 TaxID=3016089 RepID=UPI00249B20EA|nr:Scr1 family TA system antitoxin-like transcriptional regulator [Micromonospora sp. WMMD987]WFE96896.1 Scr1 family TA system antitoxin-like transcriptional regulator [Micromonospora sp. WMMD987]